jgi:hypothetical protein
MFLFKFLRKPMKGPNRLVFDKDFEKRFANQDFEDHVEI